MWVSEELLDLGYQGDPPQPPAREHSRNGLIVAAGSRYWCSCAPCPFTSQVPRATFVLLYTKP